MRHFKVFGGNISSATPIEVDFESGFRGRMISMAILGELLGSKMLEEEKTTFHELH